MISQKTFLHSCWRMREFISYRVTDCKILSRGTLIWHMAPFSPGHCPSMPDCRVNETPNLIINWIEVEDLTPMYLSNIMMFGIFTLFLVNELWCHFSEKWYHLCQIRNQVFIFYFSQKSFIRITPIWHLAIPRWFYFSFSPLPIHWSVD